MLRHGLAGGEGMVLARRGRSLLRHGLAGGEGMVLGRRGGLLLQEPEKYLVERLIHSAK